MESENSSIGKSESPSLDKIKQQFHPSTGQESLDDMNILTLKDVTSQFLQKESNEGNLLYSDESYQSLNANFDGQASNNGSELSLISRHSLVENENDKEPNAFKEPTPKDEYMLPVKENNSFNDFSENLMSIDDSSKNFIPTEQTNFEESNVANISEKPVISDQNIKEEFLPNDKGEVVDLLLNDEIVKGLDEFSFTPKKGESSPSLHVKEEKESNKKFKNGTDSPILTKFMSEPGLAKEHELLPSTEQGDGFNVKEADEEDQSDNDFVPEPIPKDYPEIGVMEGKQFLAAIGLDTLFHPNLLNPKVESLVYWRNPKKSGVVFGSVMVILLSLTTFSLISIVAYSSLTVLGAALGFRIYKNVLQVVQKTSEGQPFKEYLDIDLTVNPDKAREISDLVVSYVNWAVTKCRSLFLVEDIIDSVKFGAVLWCLTYVGSWFNGLSLLIIAFVGLFTLPKVYENNKTQIDANLNVVKSKINEVTERIKAVAPVGKKDESKGKSD